MKKIASVILFLLLIGFAFLFFKYYPQLAVVNSYSARLACTCHFEGGRSVVSIKAEDLSMSPLNLAQLEILEGSNSIRSTVFGLQTKIAQYRKGQGCVLIHESDDYKILFANGDMEEEIFPLPMAQGKNPDLEKVIEEYFGQEAFQFRSLLVLKNDSIIGEKYANGITSETVQLGWSMTKSITNALIGIAVKNGILKVSDNNLFAEWKDDDRSTITIENLLHMNPGLYWEEEYAEISDATRMLFLDEDMIPNLTDNTLEFTPGENWKYSSGNTNLLMAILRKKLGDEAYWMSPKNKLFAPLGMNSAFIETDEAGNFLGSSYGYATLRDWVKFGRLFLNDGLAADGSRILPEGWVQYSTEPAGGKIDYNGAHWWLNKNQSTFKDAPEDLFYASGYQGQYVYIIPSLELIIARTGLSSKYDENEFLKKIIQACSN